MPTSTSLPTTNSSSESCQPSNSREKEGDIKTLQGNATKTKKVKKSFNELLLEIKERLEAEMDQVAADFTQLAEAIIQVQAEHTHLRERIVARLGAEGRVIEMDALMRGVHVQLPRGTFT